MNLEQEARAFAEEIAGLLAAVLPGPHPPVRAVVQDAEGVVVIRPDAQTPAQKPARIALSVNGSRLAHLAMAYTCCADSAGRYLAISTSKFELHSALTRTPLLRLDYNRATHRVPYAHYQLHAESGAFSHLLSMSGRRRPHDISSLHLPVGGHRFRPCLEDLLQFLVEECGVDAHPDWRAAVDTGRERWRRKQAASVVRDTPDEAARVLVDLGYKVEPPLAGICSPNRNALRRW